MSPPLQLDIYNKNLFTPLTAYRCDVVFGYWSASIDASIIERKMIASVYEDCTSSKSLYVLRMILWICKVSTLNEKQCAYYATLSHSPHALTHTRTFYWKNRSRTPITSVTDTRSFHSIFHSHLSLLFLGYLFYFIMFHYPFLIILYIH